MKGHGRISVRRAAQFRAVRPALVSLLAFRASWHGWPRRGTVRSSARRVATVFSDNEFIHNGRRWFKLGTDRHARPQRTNEPARERRARRWPERYTRATPRKYRYSPSDIAAIGDIAIPPTDIAIGISNIDEPCVLESVQFSFFPEKRLWPISEVPFCNELLDYFIIDL